MGPAAGSVYCRYSIRGERRCQKGSHLLWTYSSLRLRRKLRELQIAVISYQLSSRFRLKSSSTIFKLRLSRSLSTCAIHVPSNTTIRSSCSSASCCRIFSKPTSSTVLPLMWISFAVAVISSALVEAYFFFSASKRLAG